MIREIVLVDFMSHRNTVIELAAGLTVLVGPNNSGKSAVTAALQVIAANVQKEHVVRHGCNECSITIETDDGHTVTWRRKNKTVSYTINGEEIHRLKKGGVPDELHRVLKLAPVESVEGGDSFSVHFAPQKEPIFLLNGTGKQAAAFFASASDASRLMAMQQLHKDKTREHASAEKRLLVEIESMKGRLEDLTAVPALEQEVSNAAAEYQRLADEAAKHEKVAAHIRAMNSAVEILLQTQNQCDAFAELQTPPELRDVDGIEVAIRDIAMVGTRIAELKDECRALDDLIIPPTLVDTRPLAMLCVEIAATQNSEFRERDLAESLRELVLPPALKDIATLERLCRETSRGSSMLPVGEAEVSALEDLTAPPELMDEKAIIAVVDQLKMASHAYAAHDTEARMLKSLAEPPAPADDRVLRVAIEHFEAASLSVIASQRELEQAKQEAGELKSRIAQWAGANPTCPTCGAEIDEEQLLMGHEAHDHE